MNLKQQRICAAAVVIVFLAVFGEVVYAGENHIRFDWYSVIIESAIIFLLWFVCFLALKK